jgi:hypothetical protein
MRPVASARRQTAVDRWWLIAIGTIVWMLFAMAGALAVGLAQAATVLAVAGEPFSRIAVAVLVYGFLWTPTVLVGCISGLTAGLTHGLLQGTRTAPFADAIATTVLVASFVTVIRVSGILGRGGADVWWWVYVLIACIALAASAAPILSCRLLWRDWRQTPRHPQPRI